MSLEIVILAAGQGTRMRSALPKVLHPVAGNSMLGHVIHSARQLDPQGIHVVIGHGAELVRERLAADDLNFVLQDKQLGTGHAVAQALPFLTAENVLILYGDVPLIAAETLQRLLALFSSLFVPRYFVELRWLLAHIGLHLRQQLALLIGKLIGVQYLAACRRFGRRTYARLTAFQLFDVSPALFRFWRDAITGDFLVLQRFGLFFLVMRNEVQTTDKGHEYGCSNSNHCGRYRRRIALFFP